MCPCLRASCTKVKRLPMTAPKAALLSRDGLGNVQELRRISGSGAKRKTWPVQREVRPDMWPERIGGAGQSAPAMTGCAVKVVLNRAR
jgi:hypothetical protein